MAAEECLVGAAPDYKGRIGSINSTLFTYDYIGSRVLQRSHYVTGGNDIDVDYAYDNLGRVTDIVSSDGTIDFDYTYAAGENNIADIAFNHRTSTPSNDFVYDNLDRLYSVEYLDDTTDTEAFTMDLLGNRTNVNLRDGNDQAYTVNNANNRYTAVASNSLTYDNAGNTTTDQNDHTYTYDYENRIETITRPSDSSTIVTYTYDALGRRIKMVDAITPANSRLYYFSDNWQVLEEYSVAAVPARTAYYVWGNYIDELLFIWNGDSQLAAHALQDHLFSTVALVDVTAGTVLERCEYNAYGKPTIYTNMNDWQTGTPPTTQNYSEYGNPYLFTGRRLDKLDSGSFTTYYYRNRYYDVDTGRFLQKDPLDYVDGMNLYEYVRSNPCIGLDPQGTDFIAVASRNVAFSGRGHYSCQLWKCCKKFTPLNYTEGFSESEIKKKCGGKGKDSAKKIDYFELKVLKGYNVWGHWGGHTYVTKAHGWHIKHDPWMSEIRYKGREDKDDKEAGTDIMPVMNGSPVVMKIMFEYTKMKAGTFPWAEQYNASDTGIKNWPKSMYKVWQTNSNTFIRWVMGPGMTEMTVREHPGDYTPQQNTDEWGNSGKLWQFYPAHQPWKNSDPAPPRPSH